MTDFGLGDDAIHESKRLAALRWHGLARANEGADMKEDVKRALEILADNMPCDLEAERGVLVGLMHDPSLIAANGLTEEHFWDKRHRIVFCAIRDIAARRAAGAECGIVRKRPEQHRT
jgi:hypothetical protein